MKVDRILKTSSAGSVGLVDELKMHIIKEVISQVVRQRFEETKRTDCWPTEVIHAAVFEAYQAAVLYESIEDDALNKSMNHEIKQEHIDEE